MTNKITIYRDIELIQKATIKKYLIVQQEGTLNVQRNVKDYTIQGCVMDEENI